MQFFVAGAPVGQGRPRFTTKGGFPRAYDPAKSRDWKKRVAYSAREAFNGEMLKDGPVSVEMVFVLPRLKSKPKATADQMKPDLDNLAKGVLDALTGVLWADDKMVTSLIAVKYVCHGSEEPGVWVTID